MTRNEKNYSFNLSTIFCKIMQNNKSLLINSLVCTMFAVLGSISTVLYFNHQKYLSDEYEKVDRKKRDNEISQGRKRSSVEADKLTDSLKGNSAIISEATQLMKTAQKLKGKEVYKIRIWQGTFQKYVRFVYAGVCPTVEDGCRSDNDLNIIGKYPEIEKTLTKLPFNSHYVNPSYGLVLRELVEGNNPKIEIGVERV